MTKYQDVKEALINLFNEACLAIPNRLHHTETEDFIIYKGFRISKTKDDSEYVEVVNVRQSDFYKPLSDSDLKECIKLGFEKFCDVQKIANNFKYINKITKKIANGIVNSESISELVEERRAVAKEIRVLINKTY